MNKKYQLQFFNTVIVFLASFILVVLGFSAPGLRGLDYLLYLILFVLVDVALLVVVAIIALVRARKTLVKQCLISIALAIVISVSFTSLCIAIATAKN